MKYDFWDVNDNVLCCFVYINSLSKELSDIIDQFFMEIISGKKASQRAISCDDELAFYNASKYISNKKNKNAKVGIVGEFLFHCLMRLKNGKINFMSCVPTIGFSDSYQGFFKGFDGCYYGDNEIWISEVKSKLKSNNLDKDNETKLKLASSQLEAEVRDNEINRWENAKKQIYLQLTDNEIDENNIYELLSKKDSLSYNKILCTMLICDDSQFSKEYISKYYKKLFDKHVDEQRIFIMCIRNYDYNIMIKYIEQKFGAKI